VQFLDNVFSAGFLNIGKALNDGLPHYFNKWVNGFMIQQGFPDFSPQAACNLFRRPPLF